MRESSSIDLCSPGSPPPPAKRLRKVCSQAYMAGAAQPASVEDRASPQPSNTRRASDGVKALCHLSALALLGPLPVLRVRKSHAACLP